MGISSYFSASPFDADVEKATNENNSSEDWSLIMDICDKVGSSSQKAKDCLKSLIKRLSHQDPHIVLQAVTLLDACVSNCGKNFHLEVASREFDTEIKKVVRKWPPSSPVGVKLRTLVKKWSDAEFRNDPQLTLLTSMYSRMKIEGIDVSINTDPTTSTNRTARPADPDTATTQQEVDDIAKAIELSLKESSSPKSSLPSSFSGSGGSSLYPSIVNVGISSTVSNGPTSSTTEPRKVRALYDFEAAEENELTFFAGEIIHVLDDSDANWWKGCNQRGEGLFPNNFVTSDLNVDPVTLNKPEKKGVQFNETVEVKSVLREKATEIEEGKIDRVLHLLHEADPNDDSHDPPELLPLEEDVMEMGPLIDAELEKVDRKHAQLSQISASLVEAMNMYHGLLREPVGVAGATGMKTGGPGLYSGGHLPPHLHHQIPPISDVMGHHPMGHPLPQMLPPQMSVSGVQAVYPASMSRPPHEYDYVQHQSPGPAMYHPHMQHLQHQTISSPTLPAASHFYPSPHQQQPPPTN